MTRDGRAHIGIAALVALLAVLAAVWAWSADDGRPTSLPTVQSHGLDPDQAACFSYALVIRHSNAVDLNLRLGKYQGLDPDAGGDLSREVDALDRLSREHPQADSRLTTAFDEVAAEGEAVGLSSAIGTYRDAVTGRSAELAQVRDTCLEVADFNVDTLSIGESGLP